MRVLVEVRKVINAEGMPLTVVRLERTTQVAIQQAIDRVKRGNMASRYSRYRNRNYYTDILVSFILSNFAVSDFGGVNSSFLLRDFLPHQWYHRQSK